MSKIISFAYTTPSLLMNRKTCTRRYWSERYARLFKQNEVVQAWDKLPRSHGKQVAWIRITVEPYFEPMYLMPDSDYEAEGFAFFAEHPDLLPKKSGPMGTSWKEFEAWRESADVPWIVRFQLEEVLAWPEYMLGMKPPTEFMREALKTTLFRYPSTIPLSLG